MALDNRMMADVVAAPQNDVVPYLSERLHHVVLKDEAVLTDLAVAPDKGMRTNIGGRRITLRFCFLVESCPQLVQMGVNVGREKKVLAGSVRLLDSFKWHDRQIEQNVPLYVIFLDTEGHDLVIRVVREILVSDFRKSAVTKDNKLLLLLHKPSYGLRIRISSRLFAIGRSSRCGSTYASKPCWRARIKSEKRTASSMWPLSILLKITSGGSCVCMNSR